eukprot:10819387-Karenia_brevis.AAC.1
MEMIMTMIMTLRVVVMMFLLMMASSADLPTKAPWNLYKHTPPEVESDLSLNAWIFVKIPTPCLEPRIWLNPG